MMDYTILIDHTSSDSENSERHQAELPILMALSTSGSASA